MALTVTQFKRRLRGFFGADEDSAGEVADRVHNAVTSGIKHRLRATDATLTQPIAAEVIGSVNHACTITGLRVTFPTAVTVSVTDNFTLSVYKTSAATHSVTLALGAITTNTDSITAVAGGGGTFTLSATSSNLELEAGDTIWLVGSKGGVGCLVPGHTLVYVEFG